MLGESKEVTVPLLATWYATGNNATLAGDVSRRVLRILLRSPLESPEDRDGFEHPDLREWVADNRPRLLAAAPTILSAYIQAGQPAQNLTAFGSFEAWNRTVRGTLLWVGQHDPAASRSGLREKADGERAATKCILDRWSRLDVEGRGMTIGQFVDKLKEPEVLKAEPELRDAVESLVPDYDTRKLGVKFRKWKDRLIGNVALRQGDMHKGYQRWNVN